VEDFLSRRTRLAYLDVKAARAAVPRVTALMAQEHRWGGWRRRAEERRAHAYLDTFEVPALPRASVVAAAQSA
jgi:glycerol-3-phosphate dehydrogenase